VKTEKAATEHAFQAYLYCQPVTLTKPQAKAEAIEIEDK